MAWRPRPFPCPVTATKTFRLTAVSGAQFVLKIAAANEERDVLDLQNAAIAHLRRRESLAPCLPDVIPTLDGQPIAKVADAGRPYLVRLVTYLPGVPLAHVNPHTPDLLRDFGRFLGEVDAALQDFRHPAMDRYLHWDMRHAADTITRHLDYQTDPDRRALVARYLAEFEANAAPRLPQLRRSVIHSDGNDYNVLVTADMTHRAASPD
ncbi:MAG: phosphotransferase [Chloroflexi bacterium]|nr:phosphotransferase [Chloroflexota bacterium]